MSGKIVDRQVDSFNKLVKEEIGQLIDNAGFTVGNYSVLFQLLPINLKNVYTIKGTKYVSVNAACTITNGKDEIRENVHLNLVLHLGRMRIRF